MVGVAVATAAAVSVAATAASTAMRAGQSGPKSAPGVPPPGKMEQSARQGQVGGIDAASAAAGAAGASGALVNPTLYSLAGVTPTYDPNAQNAARVAGGTLSGDNAALTTAEQNAQKFSGPFQGQPGGGRRRAYRQGRKQANTALTTAQQKAQQDQANFNRLTAAAGQPTSITPNGPGGRPSIGSPEQQTINDLLLKRVQGDLTTGYSSDPTLERQITEGESTLRNTLRAQLGPDYETSTQGMQALANFNERSAELRTNFARQDILSMYPLETTAEQTETGTAANQAKLLLTPTTLDQSLVDTFGNVAGMEGNLANSLQSGRITSAQVKNQQQQTLDQQYQLAQTYGPAASLGELASGAGAAAYGIANSDAARNAPAGGPAAYLSGTTPQYNYTPYGPAGYSPAPASMIPGQI